MLILKSKTRATLILKNSVLLISKSKIRLMLISSNTRVSRYKKKRIMVIMIFKKNSNGHVDRKELGKVKSMNYHGQKYQKTERRCWKLYSQ